MARFIQLFETGKGDYTAERWQWLPEDADVESLTKTIAQTQTQPERGEP